MQDGIIRLTRKEMTERIRQLGIKKIDLPRLLEIITAFMDGENNTRLYSNRPGGNLGSPNTIVKLRRIYENEDPNQNFDFLKDEIARRRTDIDDLVEGHAEDVESAIQRKYPDAETAQLWSDEELHEILTKERSWESGIDPHGRFRLNIVNEAEEKLHDFSWSVKSLEGIGLPPQEALKILSEFKYLDVTRRSSVPSINGVEFMKSFKGFDRYLKILWLVIFARQYGETDGALPDIEYERIGRASELYARGVFESSEPIMAAAEGYIQFEPWRGAEYQKEYEQSFRRYQRSKKEHERFLKQITGLLYDDEEGVPQ